MLATQVDCSSSKRELGSFLQCPEFQVVDSLDWFEQSKSQLEPEPSYVSEHLEEGFVQP